MTPAERLALRHVGDELAVLVGAKGAPEGETTLDAAKLEFDLKLFERLVMAQRDADAARALREWIVNAVILAWGDGATWLNEKTRMKAEAALRGIKEKGPQAALRTFWDEASKYRNAVSHLKYNEKHDVTASELRAFLAAASGRARALQADGSFLVERRSPRRFLSDEVPLHTITSSSVHAKLSSLSLPKAKEQAEGRLFMGRDSARLSALLGCKLKSVEEAVRLKAGDTVLVGEAVQGEPARVCWTLVELS